MEMEMYHARRGARQMKKEVADPTDKSSFLFIVFLAPSSSCAHSLDERVSERERGRERERERERERAPVFIVALHMRRDIVEDISPPQKKAKCLDQCSIMTP